MGGINPWTGLTLDYIKIFQESEKFPIILLPGLGASWNTDGILTGAQKPQGEWQMTPFVNIYDNLANSLINSGYELGNDLFVFNYDWRQPISNIANDLDLFIQNNIGDQEINLVGHSLGGLVARAWWQDNHDEKINKIITLGSPHQGVLQAYEALAGGKISDSFSWGSAALNILLRLRNPIYKTNAQIIQNEAPVLNDLVPVFDFLKKGRRIYSYQKLTYKNEFLENINQSIFNLDKIEYLSGNTGANVNEWLIVKSPTLVENLLGLWPDGVPYRRYQAAGDETVLLKSSSLNKDPEIYSLDHRQLVSSASTIEKVLEILEITPGQIAAESVYPFNNTLVFLIASPATLEVLAPNGQTYPADDQGFVIVPNPQAGDYQAKLLGNGNGEYHLLLGQLFSASSWNNYQGSIEPGQPLTYQFSINPDSPRSNPLIDDEKHQLEIVLEEIENLNQKYPGEKLEKARAGVQEAVTKVETNDWPLAVNKVKEAIVYLFEFRRDNPQLKVLKESENSIEILTNVLASLLEKEGKTSSNVARKEYLKARKQYSLTTQKIRLQQRKNQLNDLSPVSFSTGEQFLDEAKEFLKQKDYPALSARSFTATSFFKEIF
ncbi:alpha/beta fold hydrolase [Candidatus Shapirobacteria bacterium]|nr:alpha/beta fold hydrolase [Candidatus Shapirobacteria bacterium]